MLKAHGATGQVHAIGTQGAFAVFTRQCGTGRLQLSLKTVAPCPERARVMGAQVFYIQCFDSALGHRMKHITNMSQFTPREYVFVDELAHACAQLGVVYTSGSDAMIHDEPAWP